jgi:serine protease AprX
MNSLRISVLVLVALSCSPGLTSAANPKLDPRLQSATAGTEHVEALIELGARAAALPLDPRADYRQHRADWVKLLSETANSAQAPLLQWLQSKGVEYRAFWIVDAIWVNTDATTLDSIAARSEVRYVHANPLMRMPLPMPESLESGMPGPLAIEAGVNKINAPLVWAAGTTGQGVVIAGEDTGYQWDHPALKAKYRGWNGSVADHNYNWHDSIHNAATGNICGSNAIVPCDDGSPSHGTHTLGTMLGDDGGANQIGVAPGARWIGCRNMDNGDGTPARYIECMQWMMQPTDLAGNNPDISKAPDVISNSWGCPSSEGCTSPAVLETAVDNVVAAGIMMVVAAGNGGSGCNTISDAPAFYDSAFTIGSTTSADAISSFSSRGPVTIALNNKPDVVAPGSSVRSSLRGNAYGSLSGTSMATPHVAGTAALLMSVNPNLKGHPDQVQAILRSTATILPPSAFASQVCGGIPAATIPNPVIGYGRIDAWKAFRKAETIFVDGVEGP